MDQIDSKNSPTIKASSNDSRQSVMTMPPRKAHIHIQRDKVDMTGVVILVVVLFGAMGGLITWDRHQDKKRPKPKVKKIKRGGPRWIEPR